MSTTPRTDEQILAYRTEDGSELVHASFARQLETELAHLNDEMERLKKDNLNMGHWIGYKMYEPEWNSFKKSLEIIDHWQARAEKAEADTARMDWLEKESPEDWGIRSINRATIDAAMKESSK
jgi:hypothetical protein